ncbi:Dabb family protein [Rhodococcus sp. 4CII]|uniref:Dabb family protein n=2 Tax=unclassified Rhodococcus (in: high G+C Gram-positive bacteria) TaxID=192944 RepID=UPI0017A17306|nr:Dabb family protein [Rhodococcus sp. 4CII]MBC2637749.1 Dabb family protein [Rhodococcus sp. 3A]
MRFSLQDGLTVAERDEVCRQIRSLVDLPMVISSSVCQDLGNPANGFSHTAIVLFEGSADYLSYLTDPDHAVIIDFVIPRWKKAMFCDASDEFDPTLYDRIRKTISEMASTPKIIEHIAAITA